MERIKGKAGEGFMMPLPPVDDRPNPHTIASFERWQLTLPGQHAIWNRYVVMGCTLRDYPNVPPAIKHFPEATHELSVYAIDPKYPMEDWNSGGVSLLAPVNYVVQVKTTDDQIRKLMKMTAVALVTGNLPAEPQGITINGFSARDYATTMIQNWASE